tara:strand:+ start:203 stop:499 length:297 start_codon:yes stop_codon:yes gene_type:complete
MKYLLLVGVLALGACSTTSGDTVARDRAAEQRTVSGVNENGERIRCEYIRQTGTRFRERVCRTEEEWSRIEENTDQIINDGQGRMAPDNGPSVGGVGG